jgi:flagellar protein FlaG
MAIEPISSAMTYQAQGATKTQTAEPVNTDVPEEGQNVDNVDETTAAVNQTQAEDDKQDDGSKQQSGSQNAQQKQQVVSDPLKKAIAEMNKKINNSNEEAVFGVHEETNRVMIKIVDKDTKEVVKEFPPEKTLDMIAKVWEVAGILVDEKR